MIIDILGTIDIITIIGGYLEKQMDGLDV